MGYRKRKYPIMENKQKDKIENQMQLGLYMIFNCE